MKLTTKQISQLLLSLNEKCTHSPWVVTSSQELYKQFEFANFEDTWSYLTKVSMRTHVLKHHPTIITTYNKVEFKITTHDLDNSLSELDFKMASLYESFAKKFEK